MTIQSTASEVSYAGNGVSTVFTIPFVFDTSADLRVIETDSDGDPTVVTSGFSISGGGGSTGQLTRSSPLPVGTTLTVLDNPELTQPTDYIDNDAFPAETHERSLDRTVRQVKRLHQRIERSLRVEDGDLAGGDELLIPIVGARAGQFLAFDAQGQPIVSAGTGGGDASLRSDLAATTSGADGSRLVGFRRTETGSVAQSVYAALSNWIFVEDFGAIDDNLTDNSAAIQAAFNAAVAKVHATVVFAGRNTGAYRFNTGLVLQPSSGQIHVNLLGLGGAGGNGVTLRYMGAGGTALSIFDNTRYTVSNLRITDGATGATGLALRSTSSGSNHGNAIFENVHVSLFTTGVHIGSAAPGDLAASELTFVNLEAHTNGVGVLIEGINSISIRFLNFMAVSNSTAALRWSGETDRNGQTINVHGTSFSDNAIDFDLQSACHLTVDGLYTEGTTAGAKVINTAASNDTAVPPIYVSIRNLEDFRSGSAKNTLAWAGTYIFENCAMRVGADVGDVQANNRYYLRYEGGVYVAPTYAGGGQSVVYVSARGGGTNPDNSQGIADFEEFVFLNGGTKRTLLSYGWSGHPTSAIPTALPRYNNGLRVGGPMFEDGTPQTLTGAGAVSLTTSTTWIVTTGANALTLADGTEGQHKYLVMKTDAGDGTLTPTNLHNGTTITFNDVGDSAHLFFTDGQWVFMGGTATLA